MEDPSGQEAALATFPMTLTKDMATESVGRKERSIRPPREFVISSSSSKGVGKILAKVSLCQKQ